MLTWDITTVIADRMRDIDIEIDVVIDSGDLILLTMLTTHTEHLIISMGIMEMNSCKFLCLKMYFY